MPISNPLRTVFALTFILALALASCWLDAPTARAQCHKAGEAGWVCVGPCGGPGQCAGYGCVCVGASGGVGHCVSE